MPEGVSRSCRVCKLSQPIEDFTFERRHNTFTYECKACARKRSAEYYAGHKEVKSASAKHWYNKNRVKRLIQTDAWRKAHKELVLSRAHARRVKLRNGPTYTVGEWAALLIETGNKCLCCGKTGITLSIDHIVPVSKGGTNTIDNLQPLCIICNVKKGTKTINYRELQCQRA